MSTANEQTTAKIPKRVIWLALAGAVGGFLFGFDSSVVNGAVDAMKDEFALSEAVTGFAVAVALLGCAAGAYMAGKVADRYGRIPAMKLGALLFLVSAIGTGFAFGVWDLIFWRLVGGLGIGLASVIAPAYISEISPRHVRGRLASLQQLAITTGIFAALLSDALFATSAGGADQPFWLGIEAWRWMFLAAAVPAVVYGLISYTLPESPRFLVFQGKEDEARKVFDSIAPARGHRPPPARDPRGHRGGPAGRQEGLAPRQDLRAAGRRLDRHHAVRAAAVRGHQRDLLLLHHPVEGRGLPGEGLAHHLRGHVHHQHPGDPRGHRPRRPDRPPAHPAGRFHRHGRLARRHGRGLRLGRGTGSEISLPGAWGPVALVAANVFVISFGASWGPLVWVLLGEIFPSRIRARALGLAAAAQWIANFAITLSFPVMAAASLPLTYAMYALFAAASFFFVMYKVPETNGMSLEQAETLFVPKGSVKV